MNKFLLVAVVVAAVVASAYGDLYVHAPRGSNNKLNEENTNAQNQNRLFDSQNNAQGGYQWGMTMTYYHGSLLQIEWTSQHGCGHNHPNVDCNYVLQYMCGRFIRDGTEQGTPNTIGDDNGGTNIAYDSSDSAFTGSRGQHEPLGFYKACRNRPNNAGLFAADQGVGPGEDSTRTRQNPGGNRHGFECTEERDYYPVWFPSPWKDIAVLTSNTGRCGWYQSQSQNVAKKGMCITAGSPTPNYDWSNTDNIYYLWDNSANYWDQASCVAGGQTWVNVKSWGLPAPDCYAPETSRDNHLGNVYVAGGVMTNSYKWVLPKAPYDQGAEYSTCVFRMRYNISTGDYPAFGNIDKHNGRMIDSSFNGQKSPVHRNPTINYGMDYFGNLRNLTLAVNTAQYGRTFQDRSHAFLLTARPSNVAPGARIYNLGVRGRRGNIVQCYPAVEYDFTPNHLAVTMADYIHFQWTGSDHNAAGQAGQGKDKTDRSNLIPISKTGWHARGNLPQALSASTVFSTNLAYQMAHQNQPGICMNATNPSGCCFPDSWFNNGPANNQQSDFNCNYLNAADALFNTGAVQPQSTGTFYFMSTRNNNFSNRSQKLTIQVSLLLSPVALTGVALGSAGFIGAAVVAGGVWYSAKHPTSGAANVFGSIKI